MQTVKSAVLFIVRTGPHQGLTTAQIYERYEGNYNTTMGGPETSYDSVRGRVYELAEAGFLLRDGEEKNERGQLASRFKYTQTKSSAQASKVTSAASLDVGLGTKINGAMFQKIETDLAEEVKKSNSKCRYGLLNCRFCQTR